jgi:hypothetical protein
MINRVDRSALIFLALYSDHASIKEVCGIFFWCFCYRTRLIPDFFFIGFSNSSDCFFGYPKETGRKILGDFRIIVSTIVADVATQTVSEALRPQNTLSRLIKHAVSAPCAPAKVCASSNTRKSKRALLNNSTSR